MKVKAFGFCKDLSFDEDGCVTVYKATDRVALTGFPETFEGHVFATLTLDRKDPMRVLSVVIKDPGDQVVWTAEIVVHPWAECPRESYDLSDAAPLVLDVEKAMRLTMVLKGGQQVLADTHIDIEPVDQNDKPKRPRLFQVIRAAL